MLVLKSVGKITGPDDSTLLLDSQVKWMPHSSRSAITQ